MLLVCFDNYSTALITILPRILLNVMWYVWRKQRCSANVRYSY